MKKLVLILAAVFVMTALSCCALEGTEKPAKPPYGYAPTSGNAPASLRRTGIDVQGVATSQNGFECTESGVYFMLQTNNGQFLFYGDHGSDTIVKLCGRPDCAHTGSDCNAYFGRLGSNVCYYNGSIYAVNGIDSRLPHLEVVKMNPDGTGRVTVVDTLSMPKGYYGAVAPHLWNGVFSIGMLRLNEAGKETGDSYYFKLDGSMDGLERSSMAIPYANAGNAFLTYGTAQGGTLNVFCWDPDTNERTLLEQNVKEINIGYIGIDWSYKIEDGVVYRYNSLRGEEEALFDTGLEGDKALTCFPDCLVVRDHVYWEDHLAGKELQECELHFYSWDHEFLGSVKLDYPRENGMTNFICGETPERIILTDSYDRFPRYYIEKSDFGTGTIAIHQYHLPDLTEDLAELDAKLEKQ